MCRPKVIISHQEFKHVQSYLKFDFAWDLYSLREN